MYRHHPKLIMITLVSVLVVYRADAQRPDKVAHCDARCVLVLMQCPQRGFATRCRKLGTRTIGRRRSERAQLDIFGEWHASRVDSENSLALCAVGCAHLHTGAR